MIYMKSNVELFSYIDQNQLSKEFGGTLEYSHQDWVKFRLVSPLWRKDVLLTRV